MELLEVGPDTVRLRHVLMGELMVARARVASIGTAPTEVGAESPEEGEERAATGGAPDAASSAAGVWPWKVSLEFGLSGTEGASSTLNGRIVGSMVREAAGMTTRLGARHRYRTNDGDVTVNELTASARNDWVFPAGPWGAFVEASGERNEFRDYDLRLAGAGGMRYQLVDTTESDVLLRAGLGAAREFGGNDNRLAPEATLGVRLDHRINSRLSFNAYGDYVPNLTDGEQFRVVAGAALEVALNADKTMKLKAGAEDTFESSPGRASPHDVEYYVALVLSF